MNIKLIFIMLYICTYSCGQVSDQTSNNELTNTTEKQVDKPQPTEEKQIKTTETENEENNVKKSDTEVTTTNKSSVPETAKEIPPIDSKQSNSNTQIISSQPTYKATKLYDNIYSIINSSNQTIIVKTNYCYEFAYSKTVELTSDSIVFSDFSNCQIENLLTPIKPTDNLSQTISVSLNRKDLNLYESTDYVVITSLCLELVVYDSSTITYSNLLMYDKVIFSNKKSCSIKEVYKKSSLY